MQRHSRRSAWVRLEADVTTSKQFDASDDPIDEQYLGLIHCKKKSLKGQNKGIPKINLIKPKYMQVL